MDSLRIKIQQLVTKNNASGGPKGSKKEQFKVRLSSRSTNIDANPLLTLATVFGTSEIYATISSKNEKGNGWQPFNSDAKQSISGLTTLLSCLYVIHHKWASEAKETEFLARFASIIPYPPTLRAIRMLFLSKSIENVPSFDKTEITSAMVEVCRAVLWNETGDMSVCAPCASNELFENLAVQQIFGWILAMPANLYNSTTVVIEQIQKDKDGDVAMKTSTSSSSSSSAAAPIVLVTKVQPDARSEQVHDWWLDLATTWNIKNRKGLNSSNAKFLSIMPSMALRDSASQAPVLTLNEHKQVVVFTGIPGCSNGVVGIFEPIGKHGGPSSTRQVSPDKLALSLSAIGVKSQHIDPRKPQELLAVCFDRSNSMGNKAFSENKQYSVDDEGCIVLGDSDDEEDNEDMYTTTSLIITVQDARDAAIQLSNGPWGKTLRESLVNHGRSQTDVFKSIALICSPEETWFRCACEQHADLILRILKVHGDLPQELVDYGGAFGGETFDVFVQFNGSNVVMTINSEWTIWRLKIQVAAKIQVPSFTMRIGTMSSTLSNEQKKVSECGIVRGHSLRTMIIPYRELQDCVRTARFTGTSQPLRLRIDQDTYQLTSNSTAEDLAIAHCSKRQELPHEFSLWHGLKDTGDGHQVGSLLFDLRQPKANTQRLARRNFSSNTSAVIEIDYRNPRPDPRLQERYLDRMTCCKQLFENLINRLQAYGFPMLTAVVPFGSEVEVEEFTNMSERFRQLISRIEPDGGTKLYQAINDAADLIIKKEASMENEHKADAADDSKFVSPKKRILVISDGDDRDSPSNFTPESLVAKCLAHNVVVDLILFGCDSNGVMKSIALATGGYAFNPTNVEDAIKLTEHETVVFSGDRVVAGQSSQRNAAAMSGNHAAIQNLLNAQRNAPYHETNSGSVLERKQPIEFQRAAKTLQNMMDKSSDSSSTSTTATTMPAGNKRIMKEYKNLMKVANTNYDVYTFENARFAAVVMDAPATEGVEPQNDRDCLYAGATFALYIKFPEEFPNKAPEVRFLTPITHVNVNSHGRICHGILGRDWNPRTSVREVLDCVYGLLLHPDIDDALDSNLAALARKTPNDQYVTLVKNGMLFVLFVLFVLCRSKRFCPFVSDVEIPIDECLFLGVTVFFSESSKEQCQRTREQWKASMLGGLLETSHI